MSIRVKLLNKTTLSFFLLVLALGCIGQTKPYVPSLNYTAISLQTLVNDRPGSRLEMSSLEPGRLSAKIEDKSLNLPLNAVNGQLLGCNFNIQGESSKADEIYSQSPEYFYWDIVAPQLSEGESISCNAFIRVCFTFSSFGTTELKVVPSDFKGTTETAFKSNSFGPLNVSVITAQPIVTYYPENNFTARVVIKKVDDGGVAYPGHPEWADTIKTLRLNFSSAIQSSYLNNNMQDIWEYNNGTLVTGIDYIGKQDSYGNKIEPYSIMLIGGQSLEKRVRLLVPQVSEPTTYTLSATAEYGYCVDSQQISVIMHG